MKKIFKSDHDSCPNHIPAAERQNKNQTSQRVSLGNFLIKAFSRKVTESKTLETSGRNNWISAPSKN